MPSKAPSTENPIFWQLLRKCTIKNSRSVKKFAISMSWNQFHVQNALFGLFHSPALLVGWGLQLAGSKINGMLLRNFGALRAPLQCPPRAQVYKPNTWAPWHGGDLYFLHLGPWQGTRVFLPARETTRPLELEPKANGARISRSSFKKY